MRANEAFLSIVLHRGDSLAVLKRMPSESVQCCVTSPPYWGLRDYGTAKWEGGESGCDHKKVSSGCASIGKSTLGPNRDGVSGQATNGHQQEGFKQHCGKCGARRIDAQLGLERTPELYVSRLVEVFREVRRVLRADGTLWLNLGDSYNSHPGQRTVHDKSGTKQLTNRGSNEAASRSVPNLKPKDLVGIPWMVAFALRADGWYLRSDIIWAKPNPMPESVTDRPTKAHEYLFLLTKRAKYFYDADAVKEPFADERMGNPGAYKANLLHCVTPGGVHVKGVTGNGWNADGKNQGRNRRSVWTISTKPYKGAHFATFPPKLIEPCILAGSRPGDVVLDPFAGAATTGLVAQQHGREFLGIELNPAYVKMARNRLDADRIASEGARGKATGLRRTNLKSPSSKQTASVKEKAA